MNLMISSNNTLENPELKMAVLMLAILQNRHRSIENHINKFGISIEFFCIASNDLVFKWHPDVGLLYILGGIS